MRTAKAREVVREDQQQKRRWEEYNQRGSPGKEVKLGNSVERENSLVHRFRRARAQDNPYRREIKGKKKKVTGNRVYRRLLRKVAGGRTERKHKDVHRSVGDRNRSNLRNHRKNLRSYHRGIR